MGRLAAVILWVGIMAVLIVAVDLLFFRHQLWARMAANVGIVLLVGAFYFRFRGQL